MCSRTFNHRPSRARCLDFVQQICFKTSCTKALACGALVCASAPIPPPLRYTCHGCSLPHRTSIVLDSALKSHRSEATLATILTCCILLLERSLSEVRVCVRCMLHVACCMLGETLIWGFCHDPCNRFSQVYTHRLCT